MFSYNYQTFLNLEQTPDIQVLNFGLLQVIWQEKSGGVLVTEICHDFCRMVKDITMLLIVTIKM